MSNYFPPRQHQPSNPPGGNYYSQGSVQSTVPNHKSGTSSSHGGIPPYYHTSTASVGPPLNPQHSVPIYSIRNNNKPNYNIAHQQHHHPQYQQQAHFANYPSTQSHMPHSHHQSILSSSANHAFDPLAAQSTANSNTAPAQFQQPYYGMLLSDTFASNENIVPSSLHSSTRSNHPQKSGTGTLHQQPYHSQNPGASMSHAPTNAYAQHQNHVQHQSPFSHQHSPSQNNSMYHRSPSHQQQHSANAPFISDSLHHHHQQYHTSPSEFPNQHISPQNYTSPRRHNGTDLFSSSSTFSSPNNVENSSTRDSLKMDGSVLLNYMLPELPSLFDYFNTAEVDPTVSTETSESPSRKLSHTDGHETITKSSINDVSSLSLLSLGSQGDKGEKLHLRGMEDCAESASSLSDKNSSPSSSTNSITEPSEPTDSSPQQLKKTVETPPLLHVSQKKALLPSQKTELSKWIQTTSTMIHEAISLVQFVKIVEKNADLAVPICQRIQNQTVPGFEEEKTTSDDNEGHKDNSPLTLEQRDESIKQSIYGKYLTVLIHLPVSFHSLDIVNQLLKETYFPSDYLFLFIENAVRCCEGSVPATSVEGQPSDVRAAILSASQATSPPPPNATAGTAASKGSPRNRGVLYQRNAQQRLVRLLCMFLKNLLVKHIIEPVNVAYVVKPFCLKFVKHQGARELYPLFEQS